VSLSSDAKPSASSLGSLDMMDGLAVLVYVCYMYVEDEETRGVTYSSLIRLRFPPEVPVTAFPCLLGVPPFVPPFVLAGVRGLRGMVAGLEVPLPRALETLKWVAAPLALDEARILTRRSVMARGVGFSKLSAGWVVGVSVEGGIGGEREFTPGCGYGFGVGVDLGGF